MQDTERPAAQVAHLQPFEVVELRRYTIKEGERERFARCFESWFPEAHEQLGATFFGHFLERGRTQGFTMLRGFRDDDARAVVCSAFYYGPLWKEHAATMNDMIVDHTDVLLLRPLSPGRGVAVLPAVDPFGEPEGARGVVVAQVFAVKENEVDAFASRAEEAFAAYRVAGAREAGVLVTLDIPNSFPRLPFRTDGPFLVWLGILEDGQALEQRVEPLARQWAATLSAGGLLRGEPELVVLDPAARSRLRWLP
jgi:NIPSNAP